jgi:hypothetical protein
MSTTVLALVQVIPTYDAKRGDTCSRLCKWRGSLFNQAGGLEWANCYLFGEPLQLRAKSKRLLARLPACIQAERNVTWSDVRHPGDSVP